MLEELVPFLGVVDECSTDGIMPLRRSCHTGENSECDEQHGSDREQEGLRNAEVREHQPSCSKDGEKSSPRAAAKLDSASIRPPTLSVNQACLPNSPP